MNFFESFSGVRIPLQIYGTAWKKERTADLVELALKKGFRGVDTACQPRHYNEPLVGEGIGRIYEFGLNRSDLFIQTKFTPYDGQDPRNCPYDPNLPLEDQIRESLTVSLKNLSTEYLDSLVLHSPLKTWDENSRAWGVLEGFVEKGLVRLIGISNCYDPNLFARLFREHKIKPSVLQNRFYADSDYDRELRAFCNENGIYYQCFWTVNANMHIWQHPFVTELAAKYGKSAIQIYFRALIHKNIYPLYGTTSSAHMDEVLDLLTFSLQKKDCDTVIKLVLQPGARQSLPTN